jgi:phosphatidate cytidylyltransferase
MAAGWTAMLFAAGPLLPGLHGHIDGRTWAVLGVVLLSAAMLIILLSRAKDWRSIGLLAAGLAYISLSWSLLVNLRSGALWATKDGTVDGFANSLDRIGHLAGFAMPLIIIATIWLNDTMAYLVGSFIGKTPLSPISPKKTWEGTVGGILISVLLVTWGTTLWIQADPWAVAAVSSVTAVAGTFGDLLESKLKRLAGVKDSGHFMPGHGGFLDRFDSLLVAIPFAWILCKLLLR